MLPSKEDKQRIMSEGVVKSRLKELVARREQELGRRIEQQEIVAATELDKNTISRWMSPEPIRRIEVKAWLRLAAWLDCNPSDLLAFEQVAL